MTLVCFMYGFMRQVSFGELLPMSHHKNFRDLRGIEFGNLTVYSEAPRGSRGEVRWICICKCGKFTNVSAGNLKGGNVQSCGCSKGELITFSKLRHGATVAGQCSGTYRSWAGMLKRCRDKANNRYKRYGGRGITVCQSWQTFDNFLADMGERPDGMSIDRIDNDGHYSCGTCEECIRLGRTFNGQWIPRSDQQKKTSKTIYLTVNGVEKCVSDWCKLYNIQRTTLHARLKAGWDAERAVTTPVRRKALV